MRHTRDGVLSMLMRVLSLTGGPVARTIWVAVTAAALWRSGRRPEAIFLAVTVGGTGVTNSTIKRLVGRRRPGPFSHFGKAEHDSFPSGHTSGTCALTGAATFVIWRSVRDWRIALASLLMSIAVSGLMGYSRVYLQRHHVSDVIAGLVLGIIGLAAGVLGFQRWVRADAE